MAHDQVGARVNGGAAQPDLVVVGVVVLLRSPVVADDHDVAALIAQGLDVARHLLDQLVMPSAEGLVGQAADLHALDGQDGGLVLAGIGNPGIQQGFLGFVKAAFAHVQHVVVFQRHRVHTARGQHLHIAGIGPEEELILLLVGVSSLGGERTLEVDHGQVVRQQNIPHVAEGVIDVALLLVQLLFKDGGPAGLHIGADGHVASKRHGEQNGPVCLIHGQAGVHRRLRRHLRLRGLAHNDLAVFVKDGDGYLLRVPLRKGGQAQGQAHQEQEGEGEAFVLGNHSATSGFWSERNYRDATKSAMRSSASVSLAMPVA